MRNEFFPNIPAIEYEGPDSRNPLAFKFYNPDELIGDKTMAEHMRFSVAYWHTLNGTGADPFGVGVNELGPVLRVLDVDRNAVCCARTAVAVQAAGTQQRLGAGIVDPAVLGEMLLPGDTEE